MTDGILEEGDLPHVYGAVISIAANWKHFGTALGIAPGELDMIQKNHQESKDCLREVVLSWLKQCYDVNKFGLPTWKRLCAAVRDKAGANNPALATQLDACN